MRSDNMHTYNRQLTSTLAANNKLTSGTQAGAQDSEDALTYSRLHNDRVDLASPCLLHSATLSDLGM